MSVVSQLMELADDVRDSLVSHADLQRLALRTERRAPSETEEHLLDQAAQAAARRQAYSATMEGAPPSAQLRCPVCWIRDGISSALHSVGVPHPGPPQYDGRTALLT